MNSELLMKEKVVDLGTDTNFEKLAAIGNQFLGADDLDTDIDMLVEKQAYADDATFADPVGRLFSIASPIETKFSAMYATKCASMLEPEVIDKINDACKIYNIDIEVPHVEKVANVLDDPAILAEIDAFDEGYKEPETLNKYAGAKEYGTEFETCLAARAQYVNTEEDIDALHDLAKMASVVDPDEMVVTLHKVDSEMGLDTPWMQQRVGSPEYAVFEKVAGDTRVDLGTQTVPLSALSEYQDEIKDMGVDLDWDGESEDALKIQIENLPSDVKKEIGSWVK